ncbi:MAG: hypothetical protein ACRD15_00695 [Vicinamibacterales bacterium]
MNGRLMIEATIFGTGAIAERAWNILTDFADCEGAGGIRVVSFADNDRRRHGSRFHGRPVWSAEELARSSESEWVVIASQWHAEIASQLRGLGMRADRLLCWNGEEDALRDALVVEYRKQKQPVLAGGCLIDRDTLPRVLILSHETLNESHGTGVLLKRYFEAFAPDHLFSVAHRPSGLPWLAHSLHLTDTGARAVGALRDALEAAQFRPDLVFATALHETDLTLLQNILTIVPPGTPVVQHFMDFVPHHEAGFLERFARVVPQLTEVWALTEALQSMLTARLGREVHLVTGLLQYVTRAVRTEHREFDAGFRTAMVGNFYNPRVVGFIRDVWRRCRATLPALGPVEWYVSPGRLQGLLDGGFDPGLDFVWRGFFGGPRLLRRLAQADLGLLALNHEGAAAGNYLRYSLPSRLTEFACAGVPLFAVASPDTPLAAFIARHGVGRTATGPDIDRVANGLVQFIQSREARARAGAAGRSLAEREFRIERFRDWFNGRMLTLARDASLASNAAGAHGSALQLSPGC